MTPMESRTEKTMKKTRDMDTNAREGTAGTDRHEDKVDDEDESPE